MMAGSMMNDWVTVIIGENEVIESEDSLATRITLMRFNRAMLRHLRVCVLFAAVVMLSLEKWWIYFLC